MGEMVVLVMEIEVVDIFLCVIVRKKEIPAKF
jgi:hypothetical protein